MSLTTDSQTDTVDPRATTAPHEGKRTLASYLLMPIFLVVVLVVLYLYIKSQDLDTIEARSLNAKTISTAVLQHIGLTAVSTVFVLIIAIPLGVVLTRQWTRSFRGALITIANIGQATPTIGLLALMSVVWYMIGFKAAIIALVAYAVLPVLRNTMVGIEQVDKTVLEAGRGMGMSRGGVLARLELPLAVPVILAGVRTALVVNVGTATLAAYIGAGGLGKIIVAGLSTNRILVTITGAALTAVLALLIDYLAGIVEDVLRPKGL
ncbi:osmoprotectant transport system permease protein [Antricoccus suffuscus]|uniref:Osmoprotectant transport system permease protein n=1 Tax=Antricoccus suffuscus TaxID=1629062 RepID=A0A2T0ZX35_9ACTN|nr:ABC transporter permease [Antricoccus suffuscus]PRZ40910.1 osmoprotectant transport system permease protein [Antricoccus suffuscus]